MLDTYLQKRMHFANDEYTLSEPFPFSLLLVGEPLPSLETVVISQLLIFLRKEIQIRSNTQAMRIVAGIDLGVAFFMATKLQMIFVIQQIL